MRVDWSPSSWQSRPSSQPFAYRDPGELDRAVEKLRTLPPLVTSWEIERLKAFLADAEEGKRFLLQGGDCAETLDDCRPPTVTSKLKILLQMSLVLLHGLKQPIIRVGRFAGQYAKPRSAAEESRNGQTLPSYFGDLINRPAFDEASRAFDPNLLVAGYTHAAMTLNFIRSLTAAGFADVHHPEQWDLAFASRAGLSQELREEYTKTVSTLSEAIRFMEALSEKAVDDLTRVEFFTSHEGLNLHYEAAQTRTVPRRDGYYNLTTHLPWIGERTRDPAGAHVEFFRGVQNPLGVKVGPSVTPDAMRRLADILNPGNARGKIVWITRMGAERTHLIEPLVRAAQQEGMAGLWVSDPMHGNTRVTASGIKTRSFDDIEREIERTHEVHRALGSRLGGVHFELTGEDVTECTGGGLEEEDLDKNYVSVCDPRLNYRQALEMGFCLARLLAPKG